MIIKPLKTKAEYLASTKQKPKSNLIKSMNIIRENAIKTGKTINNEKFIVLPRGFSNTDYCFPANCNNSFDNTISTLKEN